MRGGPKTRTSGIGILALSLICGCAGGANTDNSGLTFGVGGPGGGTASLTEGDSLGTTSAGNGVGTDGESGQNTSGQPGVDCIDEDGDGFGMDCPSGDDCDDADPEVNPGADERCNEEDDNCDGEVDNGCECSADGVSGDCSIPFDLGSLMMGQTELGVVANVPQQDAIDWYQVSFPAAARPGEGMPRITFAINEGEAFAFDVVDTACASMSAPCGEGGSDGLATALTDWTFVDDDPGCCAPPMDALTAWPETVYIRVYRTTPGASCSAYQLQVSR